MNNILNFSFPKIKNVSCLFTTKSLGDILSSNEIGKANLNKLKEHYKLQAILELKQIHSTAMHYAHIENEILEGDGFGTQKENTALLVRSADCQPILMAHKSGEFIAAIHCGWRGNRASFPKIAVRSMCEQYNISAKDILVVRGPSLSPPASEFTNYHLEWGQIYDSYFDEKSQTMDLWKLTDDQLKSAGILARHIFHIDMCTYAQTEDFYSFRRKDKERQGALIWKTK